jgi:hypothetical protein
MHNITDSATDFKSVSTNPLPEPSAPAVALTLITNSTGPATKTFSLDADGKLVKKSAAQIVRGEARRVAVSGVAGLLNLVKGLSSNEALVYGLADVNPARIVTQRRRALNGSAGAVCRDEKTFHFAEGLPGVLMLDYDPQPDHPAKSREELDAIICAAMPELAAVERAWRASSSAFIYRSDGTELIGSGGWRGFAIVDDASVIPALGAELYRRLWAAGHGYLQTSKSGARLDRTLIDASVWQASRLDFVAAPIMGAGLERRPPAELIFPGDDYGRR